MTSITLRFEATGDASRNSVQRGPIGVVVTATGLDTDADGLHDHNDLDSDNDGIIDLLESGVDASMLDANNDGIYDGTFDANGVPVAASGGVIPIDSDGDGLNNFVDADSDNDGITDTNEAGGTDADGEGVIDGFDDADSDGWNDATEVSPLPINDFDGDAIPNHLDLDSDNDGVHDVVESGGGDANFDGMVDGFTDNDGNGLHDGSAGLLGPDADSDGFPDVHDLHDKDGDGVADVNDLDNDNDGILDTVESPLSAYVNVAPLLGLAANQSGLNGSSDISASFGLKHLIVSAAIRTIHSGQVEKGQRQEQ